MAAGPQPSPTPRARLTPEARRKALIEATIASLVEHGAAGASTRAVAARAGVTPGLLLYHFGTKEQLLAATYRHLADELAAAGAAAVAAAGDDPRDRLRAFLGAGFEPPFVSDERLLARVALWSIAATDLALNAVHVELYRRYRAELRTLIGALDPPVAVDEAVVFAVSALLDGLWLERAAGDRGYDAPAVLDTCLALIDGYRTDQS